MYMLEGYHKGICKLKDVEKEHDADLLLGTTIVIVAIAVVTVVNIIIIVIFIMWLLFCCVCGFM